MICPGARRAIVVIASTPRTEDPWFESRQGLRFLYIAVLLSKAQYAYENMLQKHILM
jgi:hypothetical protein